MYARTRSWHKTLLELTVALPVISSTRLRSPASQRPAGHRQVFGLLRTCLTPNDPHPLEACLSSLLYITFGTGRKREHMLNGEGGVGLVRKGSQRGASLDL